MVKIADMEVVGLYLFYQKSILNSGEMVRKP